MSLAKCTFEPIGVFATEVPEIHVDKLDAVSSFVTEEGGVWKFWRGTISVTLNGKKAIPQMAEKIRDLKPELVSTFLWITAIRSWAEYVSEEQREAQCTSGLPRVIKDMISPFFGFTTYGPTKVRRLLVRHSMESQVWRVVEDPIGFLGNQYYEGTNLLRYLNARLHQLQVEGKTKFGYHAKLGILDFTRSFEVYELDKRIMEDLDFYKDLRAFTNDPATPAEAYFPTSGNRVGSWAAWARFETQIPAHSLMTWRAAIRGIIDDRNSSRQLIYMRDSGYTAKSQVTAAIQKRMEGLSATLDEDALKSPFWFSGIYGARFISMPDVQDNQIITNPKIKRVSGRDFCRMEAKGVNPFDAQPNARFMVAGQIEQRIDVTNPAEQTRILYFPLIRNDDPEFVKSFVKCDAEGNPLRHTHPAMAGAWQYKGNPQFSKDLYDQFWDYMAVCDEAYQELCPEHGDIPMPPEMMDLLIDQCSSGETMAYLEALQHFIQFGKGLRLSNTELKCLLEHLDVSEDKFREFRKKLKNHSGVKDGGGARVKGDRCLTGVGFREGVTLSAMGKIVFATPSLVRPTPSKEDIA